MRTVNRRYYVLSLTESGAALLGQLRLQLSKAKRR